MFPVDGSLLGDVVFDLVVQLVQGEGDQQSPQVAAVLQIELTVAGSGEETAISRLDHVFRIEPIGQFRRKLASGQCYQLLGVAAKQVVGCFLVPWRQRATSRIEVLSSMGRPGAKENRSNWDQLQATTGRWRKQAKANGKGERRGVSPTWNGQRRVLSRRADASTLASLLQEPAH